MVRRAIGPAPAAPPGPPPAKLSAKDRLKAATKDRPKEAPTTKAAAKKDRPLIQITDATIAKQVDRMAAGKEVVALLKTPVASSEGEVKEWLFRELVKLCIASKHLLDNPEFRTTRASGVFQLKNPPKFTQPNEKEEIPALDQQLLDAGVPSAVVNNLKTRFTVLEESGRMRSLDSLSSGNEAEQAVANKLMDVIFSDSFTDEERNLLLLPTITKTKVEEDFFEYVFTIPGLTVEQALAVFKVVAPVLAFNPVKFDGGDVVPVLKELIGDKIPFGGDNE
jgi:hypothetical protein